MGGGGVGGVQYCPVLMLNNEPHTADNGYYCAQGWIYFSRDLFLEMQDLLVSTPSLVSLNTWNFVLLWKSLTRRTRLGGVRSFVFAAPLSSQHSPGQSGQYSIIHPWLQASYSKRAEHWIGRISILYWKISVSRSERAARINILDEEPGFISSQFECSMTRDSLLEGD